jgi:hypothetical protein
LKQKTKDVYETENNMVKGNNFWPRNFQ